MFIEIKSSRQQGKNPSFVSNAISDELQSRSYFPVNISKALISTNIILKNVCSCFELSDVQINAVIVYSNLSIETSFPCIPST